MVNFVSRNILGTPFGQNVIGRPRPEARLSHPVYHRGTPLIPAPNPTLSTGMTALSDLHVTLNGSNNDVNQSQF